MPIFFGSEGLENISKQFLNCNSSITPKVWSFLIQARHLCKIYKIPAIPTSREFWKLPRSGIFWLTQAVLPWIPSSHDEESISEFEAQRDTNQERINLFKLLLLLMLNG